MMLYVWTNKICFSFWGGMVVRQTGRKMLEGWNLLLNSYLSEEKWGGKRWRQARMKESWKERKRRKNKRKKKEKDGRSKKRRGKEKRKKRFRIQYVSTK